jgi:hypothetical protein
MEFIYQAGSETIRQMPENYMLAECTKGYWIADTDSAVSDKVAILVAELIHKSHTFKFTKDGSALAQALNLITKKKGITQ